MKDIATGAPRLPLDVEGIAAVLPHRYPVLMLDRVTELEPGKRAHAYKNVTCNEEFFQGHFPGHPVMPGVLVIEAMAQAAGVLVKLSQMHQTDRPTVFYLAKVDNARFMQPVVPGDRLDLEVVIVRTKRNMSQFRAEAKVDGKLVAEAELLCAQVIVE